MTTKITYGQNLKKAYKYEFKCDVCGKFSYTNQKTSRFCSDECRNSFYKRAPENNNPYFWVFLRDNMQCQICGKSPRNGSVLHADHIYPISKGGVTSEENLITLCEKCNLIKHNKILPEKQLFSLWEIAHNNNIKNNYIELRNKFEESMKRNHNYRTK